MGSTISNGLDYDWLLEVGFMAKLIYSVPKSLAVQHSEPETDVGNSPGLSSFPACVSKEISGYGCLHARAVIMEISALAGGLKTRRGEAEFAEWLQAQMCRLGTAQPQGA